MAERIRARTPALRNDTPGGRTTTTTNGVAPVAPGEVTPELLTSKQAAALAGVGERTWWRWTRCGLAPPPIKIGLGPRAAVRHKKADLMAWIAEGCPRIDSTCGGS